MKMTPYDRVITRDRLREPGYFAPRAEGRAEARRPYQYYSVGHIRMFRQLRAEGYSWRQVALICGTPPNAPRNAVVRADSGFAYPEVTLTVLECRRSRVERPLGRRCRA